jgi:hypothetical protein
MTFGSWLGFLLLIVIFALVYFMVVGNSRSQNLFDDVIPDEAEDKVWPDTGNSVNRDPGNDGTPIKL